MERPGRKALPLVVLLLVLVAGWWAVSSTHIVQPIATHLTSAVDASGYIVDTSYVSPGPIVVVHTKSGSTQTYSGSLMIPNCDTFSVHISTSGNQISLAFTILTLGGNCTNAANAATPFVVTYSTSQSGTPTLDGITINGASASFSVTEQS